MPYSPGPADCRSINQSMLFYCVCQKVDQRAGQISLPHVGITKTERNRTINIKPMSK